MTKGWRSLIRKVWRTSVLGRRVTSWCEERNWQKQLVVIHTATQQSDVLLTNQEPARQHLDIQPPRNQSGTFIRPLVTVKRWTSCLPASHLNRPISWRDQPQTDTAVMDTKRPMGRNLQPPACEQPQTNQQSVSINIKNTHTHTAHQQVVSCQDATDQPATSYKPCISLFANQQEVIELYYKLLPL